MRIIERLRKMKRLKVKTLLREEDKTIALYAPLEDLMLFFIDIALDDCNTHWKEWGFVREKTFLDFLIKYVSKVFLHELDHWGGDLQSDKQAEYVGLMLVWNQFLAKAITELIYPDEPPVHFPNCIIELNEDEA